MAHQYYHTALLISLLTLAACARPAGDLGRIEPSVVQDSALSLVGKGAAIVRHDPVSMFRKTDEEVLLENLAWSVVRPPHTHDWISGALVNTRQTRIFPSINRQLDFRAYLLWLRLERFNSSETRWNRIIADIRADQGAITPFYDQARRIYVIDQQRIAFLEENKDLGARYAANTYARVKENEAMIQMVLDSMEYRFAAYDHAIKRLTVETPSPRAQIARDELERYRRLVETGGDRGLPFFDNPELLSSRIKNFEEEKPVPQK